MILASRGAIGVPDRHCKVFKCDRWGWARSPLQTIHNSGSIPADRN
ncbi:hypothetical protein QUA69_21875 [Microcoleus sp. LAD1_D1]